MLILLLTTWTAWVVPLHSAITDEYIGSWSGYITVEVAGESGSGHLLIEISASNGSLTGTVTFENTAILQPFQATISNGKLVFQFPNLDSGNSECSNWNLPATALLDSTASTMHLIASGTICGTKITLEGDLPKENLDNLLLELSKQISDSHQIDALIIRAENYSIAGEKDKAVKVLAKALTIAQSNGSDYIQISHNLSDIADIYARLGEFDLAQEAINGMPIEDSNKLAARVQVAKYYTKAGKKDKAVDILDQALAAARESCRSSAYTTIGHCYIEIGLKNAAIEILHQALNNVKKEDIGYRSIILARIAAGYAKAGKKMEAVDISEQSLHLARLSRPSRHKYQELAIIGGVFLEYLEQPNVADELFSESIDIVEKIDRLPEKSHALTWIAGIYSNIEKKEKAISMLSESIAIAKSIKDEYERRWKLGEIATMYAKIGRIDLAFDIVQQNVQKYEKRLALFRVIKKYLKSGHRLTENDLITIRNIVHSMN